MSIEPNIFTTFNVPSYFELTFLVTSRLARGKGLAQILARESLELARECAAPLAVIYCTHIASARIAEKLDMKLVATRRVKDVEAQGEAVVLPTDDVYYVYAMHLPSITSSDVHAQSSAAT